LTSLIGKFFGTYDPTVEEFSRDMALESIMTLGGETLIPGGKLTAGLVGKGVKNLLKYTGTTKLVNSITEGVSSTVADSILLRRGVKSTLKLAGASEEVADEFIDNTMRITTDAGAVQKTLAQQGKKLNKENATDLISGIIKKDVTTAVRGYERKMTHQLDTLEKSVLNAPEANKFSYDTKNFAEKALNILIDTSSDKFKTVDPLLFLDDKGTYQVIDEKALKRFFNEVPPADLNTKVAAPLKKLVSKLNIYADRNITLKGKSGINEMLSIEKDYKNIIANIRKYTDGKKAIDIRVEALSSMLQESVSSGLDNVGGVVADNYSKFKKLYYDNYESIKRSRDFIDNVAKNSRQDRNIDLVDKDALRKEVQKLIKEYPEYLNEITEFLGNSKITDNIRRYRLAGDAATQIPLTSAVQKTGNILAAPPSNPEQVQMLKGLLYETKKLPKKGLKKSDYIRLFMKTLPPEALFQNEDEYNIMLKRIEE
jgi:hypothetical protein